MLTLLDCSQSVPSRPDRREALASLDSLSFLMEGGQRSLGTRVGFSEGSSGLAVKAHTDHGQPLLVLQSGERACADPGLP